MVVDVRAPAMQLVLAGELTEIDLAALQGLWTAEQYLRLTAGTNRLLEFTDGVIEVLPMPTDHHQAISLLLLQLLLPWVQGRGGALRYSALRVQIRPGKYREPDLLLLLDRRDPRKQDAFWLGADLVIEIVSPDNPARDRQVKRADYAEAAIPEYWIVDPAEEAITVLRLAGGEYVEHGVFRRGDQATSALLAGLTIPVDAVLDAE
ncbi:MAG: Uma2 family endonuclease [Acidimicrobiales bacterium]